MGKPRALVASEVYLVMAEVPCNVRGSGVVGAGYDPRGARATVNVGIGAAVAVPLQVGLAMARALEGE